MKLIFVFLISILATGLAASSDCENDCADNDDICHEECTQQRRLSKRKIPEGHWSQWSAWGTCSKTCNGGTQTRSRTCQGAISNCVGNDKEEKLCNQQSCQGQWTQWNQWSTCASNQQTRTRSCANGAGCPGQSKETRKCGFGEWSTWTACSVTCGSKGQQTRARKCVGVDCSTSYPNAMNEKRVCVPAPPICTKWSDWSIWSTCSRTCGGGEQQRNRTCVPIGEAHAKVTVICPGQTIQTQKCNTAACPQVKWSEWSSWTSCSATCGVGGRQTRKRNCQSGTTCTGPDLDFRLCNGPKPCEHWGDWSQWSQCTKSCGGGEQTRQRPCVNGKPGSAGCAGYAPTEKRPCNTGGCPTWSEWQFAGPCSVTCGNGTRRRTRTCTGGNKKCIGNAEDTVACTNAYPCKA